MSRWRILFADNDPLFLDVRGEFLEKAGFEVIRAHSVDDAERILRDEVIHLAILDIRLTDDNDVRDISGLLLARKEAYRTIPKIILTSYPTYQHVRQALGTSLNSIPPAVDFLAKDEGPDAMIGAIERAILENVRVNPDLLIVSNENKPVTLIELVNLIDPGLERDRRNLLARADELDTLFRHVFYREEQVILDRLLWQRGGRAALLVFTFAKGEPVKSLIVVCGRKSIVAEEARRYRMFAPAPGMISTLLLESHETLNLAANAYALAGANLDNIRSLSDIYRTGPDRLLNSSINTLFDKALAEWHQGRFVLEDKKSLGEIYCDLLASPGERITEELFEDRMLLLIRQIPRLGLGIERTRGSLVIRPNGETLSFIDPTTLLGQASVIEHPVLLVNTPGTLSGDDVLVDGSGQAWLTSFANAGLAPVFWSHVSLEAAIRFDWVDSSNLRWICDMERSLVSTDFSKVYIDDVEAPLRKPMKTIHAIRRLASQTSTKNSLPYHLGIFYQAVSRIAQTTPATIPRLLDSTLAQLAHALIAAAMISDHIVQMGRKVSVNEEPETPGIRIDKANRVVSVDGKEIELTGAGYNLLCNLYDHPDQLRTRQELIEQVFSIKYDEYDRSQISRLNTAINRLRRAIQDDADTPRFLFTHPGGGYRLVPNPKGS